MKNSLKGQNSENIEEKNREPYSILGQGIIMLCSATAVILTIIGTMLGLIIGKSDPIEGLPLLFVAIVIFVLSFVAGIFAHFTLISVVHQKRSIYEKALTVPVKIQQVFMVIGLILVICFAGAIIF